MRTSYILLDEYLRFLDCSSNKKIPTKPILEIGVQEAMKQSGFDSEMFRKRGGFYEWTKQDHVPISSACAQKSGSVVDIEDL